MTSFLHVYVCNNLLETFCIQVWCKTTRFLLKWKEIKVWHELFDILYVSPIYFQVHWFEQQYVKVRRKRDLTFNDPEYKQQWYLVGIAWPIYTHAGTNWLVYVCLCETRRVVKEVKNPLSQSNWLNRTSFSSQYFFHYAYVHSNNFW